MLLSLSYAVLFVLISLYALSNSELVATQLSSFSGSSLLLRSLPKPTPSPPRDEQAQPKTKPKLYAFEVTLVVTLQVILIVALEAILIVKPRE